MRGTIRRLFAAALVLALSASASMYVGSRRAANAVTQPDNPFAQQFMSDPGDGWMLLGGFLLLVALALVFAGGMLWTQERKE